MTTTNNTYWYAVQADADDDDWGTGSHDLEQAKAMARKYPEGRIAVIDMGSPRHAICVDIIHDLD